MSVSLTGRKQVRRAAAEALGCIALADEAAAGEALRALAPLLEELGAGRLGPAQTPSSLSPTPLHDNAAFALLRVLRAQPGAARLEHAALARRLAGEAAAGHAYLRHWARLAARTIDAAHL
jgi:hypothetical protein